MLLICIQLQKLMYMAANPNQINVSHSVADFINY